MIANINKQLKIILATLNYSLASVLFLSLFFIQYNFLAPGTLAGRFAIYTLWIIAIPGILNRFKSTGFLRKFQIVLTSIRRQLGILMFILVSIHFFWSRGFSYINNGLPLTIPLFQVFGLVAYLFLISLALTSNNWSVRKMKKWWQRLHYLNYLVMFLLVFHTALFPVNTNLFGVGINLGNTIQYALPTFFILFIQIISWVNLYSQKKVVKT